MVVVEDAWRNRSNCVGEGLTKMDLNRQKPERAELLDSIETPSRHRVTNAVEPRRRKDTLGVLEVASGTSQTLKLQLGGVQRMREPLI